MKRRLDDNLGALHDEPRVDKIEKWVIDAHLRTWGYK